MDYTLVECHYATHMYGLINASIARIHLVITHATVHANLGEFCQSVFNSRTTCELHISTFVISFWSVWPRQSLFSFV